MRKFTLFSNGKRELIASLALAGLAAFDLQAGLTVGTPFGNGMVLQRDMPIPVWGWASAGVEVTVSLSGNQQSAKTDQEGRWKVILPAMPAGGPHEMVVKGEGEIRFSDVWIGEVWICSGQSNMDMKLKDCDDAGSMIAAANLPKMRVLRLQAKSSGLPLERLESPVAWTACSPETAGQFSAVAFYFGRELLQKLDVPVGLIVGAAGGTAIEPWVPREGMDRTPEVEKWAKAARYVDEKHLSDLAAWEATEAKDRPKKPEHPYMDPKNDRRSLGNLYNGTFAPIAGYGIRGMIWYQGESNRGDSSQAYFYFFKALVNGWRAAWGQGEFPFYYVQISALSSWRPNWHIPEIWEGQTMGLQIPNTGMAVIHDLCKTITDIHPKNKEGVGQRLALWAFAKDYGFKDIPFSGPIFRSCEVEKNQIRIRFDYAFGGLKPRDGKPLDGFTIAGADRNFVPAKAEIDGDTVLVSSDEIKEPVAVRFAWSEEAQPNLVNGAGLPASPFRTHQPW
jgi:sialate O-acetylesterase